MHILFYIEPHPIRHSFTSFLATAKKFFSAPLVAAPEGYRCSAYGNRATLALLGQGIDPTDAEQAVFDGYYTDDWDGQGITQWKELMAGEGKAGADYIGVLKSLHARAPFDLLVYWGTNGAVRRFGQEHGIPTIAMELGCTRLPYLDSIVMDPIGVNGDSIFSKLPSDVLQEIVGAQTPAFLPLPAATKRSNRLRTRSGGRPIALLPLQLYDDANLLRFSRYNSMRAFLQDVVPSLVKAGYFVVVKDHPAAYTRPSGKKKSSEVTDYLRAFPQHHWISDRQPTENLSLFAIADAVVTVNSSTGFEASLHGIPVVVMGEACYKLPGIFPSLAELLGGQFDRAAYQQRLGALHAYFFSAVLCPRSIVHDADRFIRRLASIARLSAEHPDLAGFAKAAYRAFGADAAKPMLAVPSKQGRGLKAWIVAHPRLLRLVLPLWQRLR